MADCIGTDCKREVLQAEVERLRGIVQADLEEKAEAWGEVERLNRLLDEALAWVPERGIGGQFRDEVRKARAVTSPGASHE